VIPALHFQGVLPPGHVAAWTRPVTLEIPAGALCALVASPSVAGPFLRLSGGIVAPRTGRVEVLGVDASALERRHAQVFRRQLGVGLQPGGLISNLTLRMNVIVPLLYSGAADLEAASLRADETLAAADLGRWAEARPADVPPDVRQVAVIARAVARDPSLLLLEDPFSALSAGRVDEMIDLCRREAHTIIITTPQPLRLLDEAADIAGVWDDSGPKWVRHEVGAY
jgi:ABC-type transporter Mla maintaining outer membrane lipid asymmetry ATPase subunit MlaF